MNTLFEINDQKRKDEWLTPPSIIKALGTFDLDPCSPIVRPWPTALDHYTELDNGLAKNWFGRVWCNPPYSDIAPWLKKCFTHGNAIALTFARTETANFFKYVWDAADSIFFFSGRIQFHHVNGRSSGRNAGAPSVLIAYGENNSDAIAESGLKGKHVPLNSQQIIVVGVSPKWVTVVSMAVRNCGDESMRPIYDVVERIAPDKVANNPNWKAKVRQKVQEIRRKSLNNTNNNLFLTQ